MARDTASSSQTNQSRYLSAREVATALDVSVDTVYAYVSRGLLRSEPGETKNRSRRYLREDVQKLLDQKTYRHDPAQVANDALHWGMPVLESALTLFAEQSLYYRGFDAGQLALTRTFEEVAALLWTADMARARGLFEAAAQACLPKLPEGCAQLPALQRFQIMLALASAEDLAAYDLDDAACTGARILALLVATLTGRALIKGETTSIVAQLQRGWQREGAREGVLVNAALILCADHELNASTFAARIAASADAHPYLVINAGLSVMQGFQHGGHTLLVEGLLHEVATPEEAYRVVTTRLKRGERIPGFGHQLYPQGDPRAIVLFQLLDQSHPTSPELVLGQAVITAVAETTGKHPTLDFALVVLAQTLELPPTSALAIFVLGRIAGWIGHAIEQYHSHTLLRPRARYSGPAPRALD